MIIKNLTAPPGASGTPGFTGSARTRYFSLDNRALLVNGILHPAQMWQNFAGFELTPFLGGGIGYARNQVRDFHTVGTTTAGPGIAVGSTTSIGGPANRNSFAWQGTVGLNIRPQQSHFSVNAGYRYYDGGKFEGPTQVYTNSAGWLTSAPWSGRLKANQAFVEFQYTV